MRQIFTSPRLENCEAVRELLEAAGVETRITDASPLKRATKRDFSYTDRSGHYKWPAVWVLKADDYSRARAVLREQGVELPTTRSAPIDSYLPGARSAASAQAPAPEKAQNRLRFALLGVALVLTLLTLLRMAGVV
jgi:hypothetical protein